MGFIGLACLGIYLYSEQACRPLLPLWVAPAAVLRCYILFRLLCPQNYPLFYGLSVFVWVVLQLYPPFLCNFTSFYDTLRPVRSKAAAPACSHILSHCRRQLWPPICYPSPPLHTVLRWFLCGFLWVLCVLLRSWPFLWRQKLH